jgi:autotransporter-associated beta strand protein
MVGGRQSSASGTWDTSATNWTGVSGTPWDSTNGVTINAIFNPTSAQPTITVSGSVTANTLTVGGNNNVLTSGGTINLAGTNPTVNVTTATKYLFLLNSTTWGGAPAFTKTGAGIFGWQGAVTTGDVAVNQGWVITQGSGLTGAAGTPRTITVNANGAGDAGGGFSLQQSAGTVTFSNLSLILNSGRLDFSNSANRSTNAAVQLNNTGTNFISFGSNSNFVGAGANAMTMTGNLSGAGGFTLQEYVLSSGSVPNDGVLTLSSMSNSYQGDTGIQDGILRLGAGNVIPNGASAGNLVMNAGAARAGQFNLNGFNETINGLVGTSGSFTGQIYNNASGTTSTLTVGANNATSSFAGQILNNLTGTGIVALTKIGTGTQTLSGTNTYTGSTTVSAGALFIDGNNSAATGPVTVAAGATLGGIGTLGGVVSMNGTLSPGNSPGVLTLASLGLSSSATTLMEINDLTRGTQYDGVNLTTPGGLTYGGLLSLSFGLANAVPDQTTFDLFNFSGTPTGDFTSVTSTGIYAGTWTPVSSGVWSLVSGPQTLTFSAATGDIVVVPEPGAFAIAVAGIGLAAAAWARRRNK